MTTQVKRTLIAQQAMETSDLLNLRFAGRLVGSTTPRKLMVAVPDGPSTDGGKKVRQSIVLAAANDPSASTVMVGWLDIAQKRAELRVHAVVKAQYEQRFRQPFDVTQDQFDALMRDVQSMLGFQEIQVAIIQDVPQGHGEDSRATMADMPKAAAAAATENASSAGIVIALGFVVLVILGVIGYALFGR